MEAYTDSRGSLAVTEGMGPPGLVAELEHLPQRRAAFTVPGIEPALRRNMNLLVLSRE